MKLGFALLARTTEVGSRTLVAGAAGGVQTHGQYMAEGAVEDPSPLVVSEEGKILEEKVWRELEAKLERIEPGALAGLR